MSNDLVAHVQELLASLGLIRFKRMFGGYGLYADDVFVALIAEDRLYVKTDDQTRARFEAAGCEPFVYDRKGNITMSYWTVPPEAMESRALMRPWAQLALEAALRARAAKPARKAVPKPAAVRAAATGTAQRVAKPARKLHQTAPKRRAAAAAKASTRKPVSRKTG